MIHALVNIINAQNLFCRYHVINVIQNTPSWHPTLICVLSQFLKSWVHWNVIFSRVITALDYIYSTLIQLVHHLIFSLGQLTVYPQLFTLWPANLLAYISLTTQTARLMRPTWGLPGADRTQVGPMLAPWTLLSVQASISEVCALAMKTRTTRTPAFWGYPPPPHDYPCYWPVHFESQVHTIDQFISDPKSKQGESWKIRKHCEKLKFFNFVINLTRDTPSNGSAYLWQIWKKSI